MERYEQTEKDTKPNDPFKRFIFVCMKQNTKSILVPTMIFGVSSFLQSSIAWYQLRYWYSKEIHLYDSYCNLALHSYVYIQINIHTCNLYGNIMMSIHARVMHNNCLV